MSRALRIGDVVRPRHGEGTMLAYASPGDDETFKSVTLMLWENKRPVGLVVGFEVDKQGRHYTLVLWSSNTLPGRILWHLIKSVQRLPAWQ